MPKVLSFANLVAPVAYAFDTLSAAVAAGSVAVEITAPAIRALDKPRRRDWFKRADSAWPCISLTEGINPTARISADNPPQLLHGFAADYDAVGKRFTVTELTDIATRCAYPPAAGGASLSGEGVHALWLFKEPIPVLGDTDYARRVMAACYSKLRVANFVAGFDEAFKKPDRLLSIDPDNFGWLTALEEGQLVDEVSTRMWAASVTADFKFDGPALDLQKVHEQIEKLYPGRWPGAFGIGLRGPRFWDSSATDATAALVTASGMVYFSDGGGFKPWSALLGSDSTSRISAESLGQLTDRWSYDRTNKEYIIHDPAMGSYSSKNRTQLFDRLALAGIDSDVELKRAVVYIEDHKSVAAVVKLANQKRGFIRQSGATYINATDTNPVPPVEGDCPFIQGLLTSMFPDGQLDYFLGWLQDSVRCVMEAEPSYAQAVFMAGSVESGKSLLQYRILTPLLGGRHADPMATLLGETGFNSELGASGHWLVSDQEGAKNSSQRANFTQRIKAIAANPGWSIHAKFKEPTTLLLNSRITFSFNKNDEALSVVPRLGHDIMDKILLLNVPTHTYFKGLEKRTIEATVAQELPAFAYWLLNDYLTPEHVRNTGRYRTKSYHSPELLSVAKACQDSSELLGWLNILFTQNEHLKGEFFDKGIVAEYTAARWLQLVMQTTGHHYNLSPNKLSAHFQNLARQYPDSITARLNPVDRLYLFAVDYKKLTTTNNANPSTTTSSNRPGPA